MLKAILIFVPTFIVLMAYNQLFYGACFKEYCLEAALPKVTIFSVIATGLLYWGSKKDGSGKRDQSKSDAAAGIACLGVVFVPLSLAAGFGMSNSALALFFLLVYLGVSCVSWRETFA